MGKIYANDIRRISARDFGKIGKIRLKDGTVLKTGKEIKDFTQETVKGGVLESAFKRKLKRQGIAFNQERKRSVLEKKVFGTGKKLEEIKEQKSQAELKKKQILRSQIQRDLPEGRERKGYQISAGSIGGVSNSSPKSSGGFVNSPGKGTGFAGPSSNSPGNKPIIPLQK